MDIVQNHNLFDRGDSYSLRGLCMIMIIMHHIYQATSASYGVPYPLPVAILLQDAGYLATSVFFLLSGFGLFISLEKNEPISVKYILNHLWKLCNPFLYIYLIDVVTYSCVNELDLSLFIKNLCTLSLTGAGSLWFMKVIFCIYMSLFCIHLVIRKDKYRLIVTWLICLTFVVLSSCVFEMGKHWWNSILCFPLGYTLAYYNRNVYEKNLCVNQVVNRKCFKLQWGGGNHFIYNILRYKSYY